MDFVVRRRIPRILAGAASQRAADGLVAGIRDARFEVRYECGRALMKLTHQLADSRTPDVLVPEQTVFLALEGSGEVQTWHVDNDFDAKLRGRRRTAVGWLDTNAAGAVGW